MVMATGSVCQQVPGGELSHDEAGETGEYASASAEATALHERLVAYVHALTGGHEPRSGVWVEHSYARPRGASHAPAAHVRVLLAPRLSAERGDVDVERVEPPPPELPADRSPECGDDSDTSHDDDWEARVTALAPSAVHARLASHALDTLRRMRLERLAGGREAGRTAARRLRLALAGAAAHAKHAQWPGVWLHATLLACMPRGARLLYDEMASELRRAAPRLAERVLGGQAPPRPRSPLAAVGPALGSDSSPWLVWLGCGRARLDARWVRRLGALVYTRVVTGGAGRGAPDAWCAAVAGSVRATLIDTLAEAGERPVILGGIGAGAALVTALAGAGGAAGGAGAGRVRGLLLLAPPLLTAEGARDTPDDVLAEVRLPLLVVAGTGAAQCWRGAAREVTRGEAGARRVLELRGADDALRLPAALRRRRRLPQHALDAAVAEECARWAIETASQASHASQVSQGSHASHAGDERFARERARRREARGGSAGGAGLKGERVFLAADDEDDYAHLPTATRPAPLAPLVALAIPSAGSDKPMDAVGEAPNSVSLCSGRVVSRGSGATPLALLPPRRRAPSPPPPAPPGPSAPALQAADIMRLPIVFADDDPALDEPAARPVTVTSGSRGYTRVIVASRGGTHGVARGLRPGPGRPTVRPGPTVRPARPVLLRRGLRLLPRTDRPH